MARGMGVPSGFMTETLNKAECELVSDLIRREYRLQVEAGDMGEVELLHYRRRLNAILRKLDMPEIEDRHSA